MMLLPYQQDDALDAAMLIGSARRFTSSDGCFWSIALYDAEKTRALLSRMALVGWKGHWIPGGILLSA